jgi:hypothetical protein
MDTTDAAAPPLAPRIALFSIVAFWALYFAILSFRAVVIYHDHYGLDSRAIVAGASIGFTIILYLILRCVPIARLGEEEKLRPQAPCPARRHRRRRGRAADDDGGDDGERA